MEEAPDDDKESSHSAHASALNESLLNLFAWYVSPKVAVDGWSYFHFKQSCLHVHRTEFFLSSVKNYIYRSQVSHLVHKG